MYSWRFLSEFFSNKKPNWRKHTRLFVNCNCLVYALPYLRILVQIRVNTTFSFERISVYVVLKHCVEQLYTRSTVLTNQAILPICID